MAHYAAANVDDLDCILRLHLSIVNTSHHALILISHANPTFVISILQHECFVCGRLGEDLSEVVPCHHESCGRFYHPQCIMQHPLCKNKKRAAKPEFACPLHFCAKCKQKVGGWSSG